MKNMIKTMEGASNKIKTFWTNIKEFDYKGFVLRVKEVPNETIYKNVPALMIILISLIYMFIVQKGPSFGWAIFFTICFGYAIFNIYLWKKDQDINLYLALISLIFCFALAGYTNFRILLTKIVEFEWILYIF